MKRFVDEKVSKIYRFSLGYDSISGEHYLSIPVANRMVDYEEYYRVDSGIYRNFLIDEDAGAVFADECRRREHDTLMIIQPGTDRGTAI